jgi:glycosyltransferase involved in cell wall biosynthesis
VPDNNPLVSIGLPVYNGEQYLRRALESLLRQTYKSLELIISDNASTDATGAICLEYAAKDQRIRYHRNAVNIGVYANFRLVLELASGDFFMWSSVDDLRPPTAVENCLEVLLKNGQAVLAHGSVLVKVEGKEDLVEVTNEVSISGSRAAERIRAYTKGLRHNAIVYGLYRRCALVKGRLGSCYGQDYLLCLQMCVLGPLEYIRTPVIICRERKPVCSNNPMYAEVPITVMNLLNAGGLKRRKCWTVLLMGCYYLIRTHGVSLQERLKGCVAHICTFSLLYRSRLAKEVLFQLSEPVAWVSLLSWHLVRQWPFSLRVARKLQAILRV